MKQYILFCFGLIISNVLYSQTPERQVISSSGGEYSNTTLQFNFTIGEAVIETFQNSGLILTQGFQQPNIINCIDTIIYNDVSICYGQIYNVGLNTYNTSGIYHDTLLSSNGCDSIIVTNLSVLNNTSATLTETACDSYTLNAQTYTASGVYAQTLTNVAGCDSTITLNLSINNPVFAGTDSIDNVCSNYTPIVDLFSYIGTGYNQSGSWVDIDNSGALSGSIFTINSVPQNTIYHFEYIVQGSTPCLNDTAFVTLFIDICGGISEVNISSNIIIYPNPVRKELTIEILNSNSMQRFEILNFISQSLYTSVINKKAIIDISHVPSGIYFVKLYTAKSVFYKRFIKQ